MHTIVHMMRHGEVDNPDGILYGRLPGFRLSGDGQAQARKVADTLADHDVKAVFASPLQRAQETATPIAAAHGIPILTNDDLIEADNVFEGLKVSVGDGALSKPRHWPKLRDPFTPSWGEPYREQVARVVSAVHEARAEAEGFAARCRFHRGFLDSLPAAVPFDAATCLLVSQFIVDRSGRVRFFADIAARLRPGGLLASSDLACDTASPAYAVLLPAWMRMMATAEVSPEALQRIREAYARDVAVLPPQDVAAILEAGGFDAPVPFFQAGLIHAWVSRTPA